MHPGYCSNGYATANSILAGSPKPYNFVNMTILQWLSSSYLCYRGSLNWTFGLEYNAPVNHMRVYKDTITAGTVGFGTANYTYTANQFLNGIQPFRNCGTGGQAATDQRGQPVITVQAPNYSKFKFQSTNVMFANTGASIDGSVYDRFILQCSVCPPAGATNNNPLMVNSYVGTGHDFGLYYFLNVPTFYYYSSAPVAT